MLFKDSVSQLLRHAHGLGMFTSIITNGSLLRREWVAENAPYLGMLGLSCDSASDRINFLHGRWPKGAREPRPDGVAHLQSATYSEPRHSRASMASSSRSHGRDRPQPRRGPVAADQ